MPMDLSTVEANLVMGQYSSLQEFLTDMKLIFQNSFKYNSKGTKVRSTLALPLAPGPYP